MPTDSKLQELVIIDYAKGRPGKWFPELENGRDGYGQDRIERVQSVPAEMWVKRHAEQGFPLFPAHLVNRTLPGRRCSNVDL